MTNIKHLENAHAAIVLERAAALMKACEAVPVGQRLAVVQRFNADPYYENRFDDIEAQIRELDPEHELLPENHCYE